jgi:hypothetical protein
MCTISAAEVPTPARAGCLNHHMYCTLGYMVHYIRMLLLLLKYCCTEPHDRPAWQVRYGSWRHFCCLVYLGTCRASQCRGRCIASSCCSATRAISVSLSSCIFARTFAGLGFRAYR